MSHLDTQPEDNNEVIFAKELVAGTRQAIPQDVIHSLEHVLDDRSNWIEKAAEIRDTLIDVVAQIHPCNEYERELMSIMAGQARELSAMLRPPAEDVIAFGQRKAG